MNPVRIGFVLLSNSAQPIPSTRIAVLNMFPYLRAAGFDPQIVFEPASATETPDVSGLASRLIAERFEIIVLQKVHGPSVQALVRDLTNAGIKSVYLVCDLVNVTMAEATSATVTVTDYLRDQHPQHLRSKIHVVHDGIEENWNFEILRSDHRGSRSRPLHAVLVTSAPMAIIPQIGIPPEWLHITILGRYPERQAPGARLRGALRTIRAQANWADRLKCVQFLASPRIHCVAWSLQRVRDYLCRADIAIIPIDDTPAQLADGSPPMWKRKSENRLTLKMSAGLPVIATPIPSYEPVIEQGVNGFFARSPAEWKTCFQALRDPALRERMGTAARASVVHRYSMEEQARKLSAILHGLLPSSPERHDSPAQAQTVP
jgi:glycosyltransferase involved in cell wall biosynthesis